MCLFSQPPPAPPETPSKEVQKARQGGGAGWHLRLFLRQHRVNTNVRLVQNSELFRIYTEKQCLFSPELRNTPKIYTTRKEFFSLELRIPPKIYATGKRMRCWSCGGCQTARFHNLRSVTCGGCKTTRFHNLCNLLAEVVKRLVFKTSATWLAEVVKRLLFTTSAAGVAEVVKRLVFTTSAEPPQLELRRS